MSAMNNGYDTTKRLYDRQSVLVERLANSSSAWERDRLLREIRSFASRLDGHTTSSPSASGIYANVALSLYNINALRLKEKLPGNDDVFREAIVFASKALSLKATNMEALTVKFVCHIELNEFREALITIEAFTVPSDLDGKTRMFIYDSIDAATDIISHSRARFDASLYEVLLSIFERARVAMLTLNICDEHLVDFHFYVNKFMLFYQTHGDNVHALEYCEKAYDIYYAHKEVLSVAMSEADVIFNLIAAINFANSYPGREVDRPRLEKAVALYDKACSLCDWDKLNYYTKAARHSFLSTSLRLLKRYDEAEKHLAWGVQEYPSDVMFYNYARCLYEHGKVEEALQWAQKSLFLVEDDKNLSLNADIHRHLKHYDESASLYIKAIAFYDDDPFKAVSYKDANGDELTVSSLLDPFCVEYVIVDSYHGLLISLQKDNDLESARIYLELAKEKAPNDPRWEIWESVLPVIEDTQQRLEETKTALSKTHDELMAQKEMTRDWALKLIKLQDGSVDKDLDDSNDWDKFEKEIDRIIDELSDRSRQDTKLFKETEAKMKKSFPNLDRSALYFLITAEMLYLQHRESEIDFAPIIVEYSKVLEAQLRSLVGDRLPPKARMLGEIIQCIVNDNISPYNKHYEQFSRINEIRKNSAHTGKLKKKDAEEIRRYYYELGLLRQLK